MQKVRLSNDHSKMEEGKQLSRQQVHMQVVSAKGVGGQRTVSSQMAAHHQQSIQGVNTSAMGAGVNTSSNN